MKIGLCVKPSGRGVIGALTVAMRSGEVPGETRAGSGPSAGSEKPRSSREMGYSPCHSRGPEGSCWEFWGMATPTGMGSRLATDHLDSATLPFPS